MCSDDYELLNALGVVKGDKKLTTVYWRLLNLGPDGWTQTKNIQIVSICLASTTASAHMTAVIGGEPHLDPALDACTSFGGSMRRFAHGINLRLPGQDRHRLYYGALLLVSADYPAAGQFCGTMESVSATHFCRHCYVAQQHRTEVVNFLKGDLPFCRFRTHEAHLRDISDVKNGAVLPKGRGLHEWGTALAEPYVLYARSVEIVPEDAMHDFFAGQLVAEMHVAFKCFARNKKISFSRVSLNKAVAEWPSHETSDVPAVRPFKAKAFEGDPEEAKATRMRLTCAQVMHFALILVPLLTGGDSPLLNLDEPDDVWTSLALHIKVISLCLKDRFSLVQVRHLQMVLLEQHIKLRETHPKLAKRHRFHFTLHIPQQILAFGPPRHYWCMRFEAKHQDIKALDSMLNFINLPKAVCRLASVIQAIEAHGDNRARLMGPSLESTEDEFSIVSRFGISPECTELTSTLESLCPQLRVGDLSAEGSITSLGFAEFSGRRWKPHQHFIFCASGDGSGGEWIAARIEALWFVSSVSELIFKVKFHSRVWTSKDAAGTSMVKLFASGEGFLLAADPSLRRVYVVPCASASDVAWLLEL